MGDSWRVSASPSSASAAASTAFPSSGRRAPSTSISWNVGDAEKLGLDERGVILVGPNGELKFVDSGVSPSRLTLVLGRSRTRVATGIRIVSG